MTIQYVPLGTEIRILNLKALHNAKAVIADDMLTKDKPSQNYVVAGYHHWEEGGIQRARIDLVKPAAIGNIRPRREKDPYESDRSGGRYIIANDLRTVKAEILGQYSVYSDPDFERIAISRQALALPDAGREVRPDLVKLVVRPTFGPTSRLFDSHQAPYTPVNVNYGSPFTLVPGKTTKHPVLSLAHFRLQVANG